MFQLGCTGQAYKVMNEDKRRLNAFELKCSRGKVGVTRKDTISKDDVQIVRGWGLTE